MENIPFHEEYRKKLAQEILDSPKPLRRSILDEAKKTEDYRRAEAERWYAKENKRRSEQEELTKPKVDLDLANENELQAGLETIATWVYRNTYGYNRPYDPYRGDMLCGEVTDKFIEYLSEKQLDVERKHRFYKTLAPDGSYDESFGHVFLVIKNGEENILVDPTYLQWVPEDERSKYPPVLQLRYRDQDELREKLAETPIKTNEVILPFYLGFKESHASESDDYLRID
jgi:hypothetical protein